MFQIHCVSSALMENKVFIQFDWLFLSFQQNLHEKIVSMECVGILRRLRMAILQSSTSRKQNRKYDTMENNFVMWKWDLTTIQA